MADSSRAAITSDEILVTTVIVQGSDYTYSVVGFVVVLGLLLSAISAIFIACICCGHCKTRRPPAQNQRPAVLHSSPGNLADSRTTGPSNPITSPRQLPTSRSFRSSNKSNFPLPPQTADTSISAHQSATPLTPASVIHLGQLPPLDHTHHHHGRSRRPSLPPLSSTPSHASRSHFRHYHQLSDGLQERLHPLASGEHNLDRVGGATGGCRTPMSAGVLQSSVKFPSPLVFQEKQHRRAPWAGHAHQTSNEIEANKPFHTVPQEVPRSTHDVNPSEISEASATSAGPLPLTEGVATATPLKPLLPEGNGVPLPVKASSTSV